MLTARRFTVAEISGRLQVTTASVRGWINSGELEAINIARSRAAKKPRWRITEQAIERFEHARGTNSAVKPKRIKSVAAQSDPGYINYF